MFRQKQIDYDKAVLDQTIGPLARAALQFRYGPNFNAPNNLADTGNGNVGSVKFLLGDNPTDTVWKTKQSGGDYRRENHGERQALIKAIKSAAKHELGVFKDAPKFPQNYKSLNSNQMFDLLLKYKPFLEKIPYNKALYYSEKSLCNDPNNMGCSDLYRQVLPGHHTVHSSVNTGNPDLLAKEAKKAADAVLKEKEETQEEWDIAQQASQMAKEQRQPQQQNTTTTTTTTPSNTNIITPSIMPQLPALGLSPTQTTPIPPNRQIIDLTDDSDDDQPTPLSNIPQPINNPQLPVNALPLNATRTSFGGRSFIIPGSQQSFSTPSQQRNRYILPSQEQNLSDNPLSKKRKREGHAKGGLVSEKSIKSSKLEKIIQNNYVNALNYAKLMHLLHPL